MGRHKGIRNRRTFRQSQHVTYKGERAIVINNASLSLLRKIVISTRAGTRLEVFENDPDLVKGWKR
jgi:hypothetical protein